MRNLYEEKRVIQHQNIENTFTDFEHLNEIEKRKKNDTLHFPKNLHLSVKKFSIQTFRKHDQYCMHRKMNRDHRIVNYAKDFL